MAGAQIHMIEQSKASFYSSSGRVGRVGYLLNLCWLLVLASAFILFPPISLFAFCIIALQTVKRLRDCGFRSAWALLLVLPFVNLALLLFLVLWPRHEEEIVEHERLQEGLKNKGDVS